MISRYLKNDNSRYLKNDNSRNLQICGNMQESDLCEKSLHLEKREIRKETKRQVTYPITYNKQAD